MPEREDFVISTANKQSNFLQHVMTILRAGGSDSGRVLGPQARKALTGLDGVYKLFGKDHNPLGAPQSH